MKKFNRLAATAFVVVSSFCIMEGPRAGQQNQKQLVQNDVLAENTEAEVETETKVEVETEVGVEVVIESHMVNTVFMQAIPEQEEIYMSLEEVIEQMSYSMDLGKPCGLSKEDFVKLMEELPYDYTGFYSRNAEFIWEMEQEYQVNAIFECGITAQEGGWARYAAAPNNYTGYTGDGGYKSFESEEAGIEATFKLLRERYINKGLNTLSSIAPVYLGYSGGTWDSKVYSAMRMIVSD